MRESTIAKYQRLCSELVSFCELRNIQSPDQVSIEHLSQFRSEWKNRNYAALKKLEALRTLFNFFVSREWINTNIAKKLSKPIIRGTPTMPFTREEMASIIDSCARYDHAHRAKYGADSNRRLRAFVLALRYTGLRMGDVCTLRKDRLTNGKLLLYTHKTGVPVFIVIPPYVEHELLAIPTSSPDHFFWNGISDPHAPINTWERAIHKLFALAAIKGGHAHRFRDTFAVELLLAGTPIEQVSVLLGHSSIRITEKHYAPWVRARQEQLEADVRRSWRGDPLIKNGLGFDGEGDSSTLVEPEGRYRVQ